MIFLDALLLSIRKWNCFQNLNFKSWSLNETDSFSKLKEMSFDNQAHSMIATSENKLVVGCAGVIKVIIF